MERLHLMLFCFFIINLQSMIKCHKEGKVMTQQEKVSLKEKTIEMFTHAYGSYKKYAYPADELMPLTCQGRNRDSEESRGDIDDALGNFSLTLIDTLDTLAVLGKIDEFETQVKFVLTNVTFNTDVVVSVFETNIRVLGGLLGAHSVAKVLQSKGKSMLWYEDQLLDKAIDIADRLLPAFNTTTGIPYPKVNLRFGVNTPNARVGHETDTCTACAGTMIMEFGALSRLTGKPIYEEKAHKAMEALWHYRSQHTDLVGTTINIHNGRWIRRDSGIGAGIDSYYEYCLKAYILFGDDWYLEKFNKHYAAIERYVKKGYMMVDVMMNDPERQVRSHVDALQAFWPGLQVLKGDLQSAIETHEMLYAVAKKFKFLPEAFTTDFNLFWAQHPLRPEFVESTYFLYQATKDPYYLHVGKHVIDSLEKHARVKCGFAALKDLRTLSHEDKMDSFVLAETFKYLYLLFSEESEHVINVDDFVFTTEAHLLPLYLSTVGSTESKNRTEFSEKTNQLSGVSIYLPSEAMSSCPNTKSSINDMLTFAAKIRQNVKLSLPTQEQLPTCTNPSKHDSASFKIMTEKDSEILLTSIKLTTKRERRLKAADFVYDNEEHLKILKELGINIIKSNDGKVQLMHQSALASSTGDAEEGLIFMQEMIQLSKDKKSMFVESNPRVVQLLSYPFNGKTVLSAGSAQFGKDLLKEESGIVGDVVESVPFRACEKIDNHVDIVDRIVLIERGDCMFIDKVRLAQRYGAAGVIIIDHMEGTSALTSQSFAMSGDSNIDDVTIPSVFLFRKEGDALRKYIKDNVYVVVRLAAEAKHVETTEGESSLKQSEKDAAEIGSEKIFTKPNPEGLYRVYKLLPSDHPPSDFFDTLITETAVKQDVLIDDDNGKTITTHWGYVGPDQNNDFKKIIRRKIEKCPTTECNKGVTVIYVIAEEPLENMESESSKNEDEKTKENNDEEFLSKLVDLVIKSKLKTVRCEKGLICTATGCYSSIEEMKKFSDLTNGILENLKEMQDKLKTTVDKVFKNAIPDFNYQAFKEILEKASIEKPFIETDFINNKHEELESSETEEDKQETIEKVSNTDNSFNIKKKDSAYIETENKDFEKEVSKSSDMNNKNSEKSLEKEKDLKELNKDSPDRNEPTQTKNSTKPNDEL